MEIQDKDLEVFSYEGTDYKTLMTQKFLSRKKFEPEDPTKIVAQIPGTIVKIMVKEGQSINPSKCLFILEAMKMKNRVYSSISGTIRKIHIAEDQRVSKNELLLELELPSAGKKSRKIKEEEPTDGTPVRKKRFGRRRGK
jgi:biotin carboxyl carrier protein